MKSQHYKTMGDDYRAVNSAIDSYIGVYHKVANIKATNMLLDNGIPPNHGEEDMLLEDVRIETNAAHNELDSLREKVSDIKHDGLRQTGKQLAEDAEKFMMDYFTSIKSRNADAMRG